MVSLKHYTQCPSPSEAEASFYSLSLLLLFNGFVLCQLCMCVSVCGCIHTYDLLLFLYLISFTVQLFISKFKGTDRKEE